MLCKTEISNFARFGIELFTHRSQVSTSAKLCTWNKVFQTSQRYLTILSKSKENETKNVIKMFYIPVKFDNISRLITDFTGFSPENIHNRSV